MYRFFVFFLMFALCAQSQDCNIQITQYGKVCVCNATYCDTVPSLNVPPGYYQIYSTSKSKLGFQSATASFITNTKLSKNIVTVDPSIKHQTIIGFGGAFTDSAVINIASLPAAAQQKLMESYFAETGIGYNLCRVPVGGTDFSTRAYSYDDNFDPSLHNFALQREDIHYKIPLIHKAMTLRNNNLNLFATAWSAPPWMKSNNDWAGAGILKQEYYQVWANFFIKFFDAYQANNITFWGMTIQNEPNDGLIPKFFLPINDMGWTPEMMRVWTSKYLGPTLRNSVHKDVKIILHDDQRLTLPLLTWLLNDKETMKYADGVGMHWYTDFLVPPSILESVKSPFKDIFIIGTEACSGSGAALKIEPPVEKGSWARGEKYAASILDNLQYGAAGWVDWNMVLDETGGPCYVNNFVDSPVLVNSTLQEFYKQPMFYALGHFSKFVVPGSVRIETTLSSSVKNYGVQALAFLRPDNLIALVMFNKGMSNISIQVRDKNNYIADLKIESHSINTLLFRK